MKENNVQEKEKKSVKFRMKQYVNKIYTLLPVLLFIFIANTNTVMAGTDYAKNGQKWLSNQAYYIGLAVVGFVLLGCIVKKSTIGAVTTIFFGGVVLFFVKNPTQVSKIGENISKIFISGS